MAQTETPLDDDWVGRAACKGMPVELFFDEHGNVPRRARMLCESCQVTDQCLDEALTVSIRDDFGFRAGTSAVQRRKIRTQRHQSGTYTPVELRFDDVVKRFYRV